MEFAKTLHDIFYLYINIRVMHKLNTIKCICVFLWEWIVRMNRWEYQVGSTSNHEYFVWQISLCHGTTIVKVLSDGCFTVPCYLKVRLRFTKKGESLQSMLETDWYGSFYVTVLHTAFLLSIVFVRDNIGISNAISLGSIEQCNDCFFSRAIVRNKREVIVDRKL